MNTDWIALWTCWMILTAIFVVSVRNRIRTVPLILCIVWGALLGHFAFHNIPQDLMLRRVVSGPNTSQLPGWIGPVKYRIVKDGAEWVIEIEADFPYKWTNKL